MVGGFDQLIEGDLYGGNSVRVGSLRAMEGVVVHLLMRTDLYLFIGKINQFLIEHIGH